MQHLTKPGVAACPPDPYPAHTATVACMDGTQSGNSPGNMNNKSLNKSSQKQPRTVMSPLTINSRR